MIIYDSHIRGNNKNCVYPFKTNVKTIDDMKRAVKYDHVCVLYKDGYRKNENFIESDVIVMDCDGDKAVINPEEINLPDVKYVIVPSRHNMYTKGAKPAVPRFHIYFPVNKYTMGAKYAEAKRKIQKFFGGIFDDNALDSARFIYGVENTNGIIWHDGSMTIEDFIALENDNRKIPQGERNSHMSHFAGRVLKRYGISEKAYELYYTEAEKCEPPLDEEELNTIWESAIKFADKITKQPGYIKPEDYGESLRPDAFTDKAQAKVFAKYAKDVLCYTTATEYLVWSKTNWEESNLGADRIYIEFSDIQTAEATSEKLKLQEKLIEKGINPDKLPKDAQKYKSAVAYEKFALSEQNYGHFTAAVKIARSLLEKSPDSLDKDALLLNTPNGTYNLETGKFYEPSSKDMITKCTEYAPSDVGVEIWEEALNKIFCEDSELIEYVQRLSGMAAVGKIYYEALIISWGEGSNGKSTFWNTIARVLGNYSGSISADALTVGCKRNVKPEMAELRGKRLVIASELDEGTRLNTGIIKQLCSTDAIRAEKKYKAPFEFIPTHTLVLYTNHLPKVGANDEGTWRRMIVVPFLAKISGDGDIKNYTDYLLKNAGGAVMKWIIEGAEKFLKYGMGDVPAVVQKAINRYRQDNDWLGHFIDEKCEVDVSYEQNSGDFYRAYREYAMENGEYVRGTTDFYAGLEAKGFKRRRSTRGRLICGIKLIENDFFE